MPIDVTVRYLALLIYPVLPHDPLGVQETSSEILPLVETYHSSVHNSPSCVSVFAVPRDLQHSYQFLLTIVSSCDHYTPGREFLVKQPQDRPTKNLTAPS